MTVAEWAEKHRRLGDLSAISGNFRLRRTPILRGILAAMADRHVRKIVCRKSAQLGWTDGVVNNFVGYVIHLAPGPMGIMFPRDQTAKDYNVEKLVPMIEATPVLGELVNVATRTLDNTQNRKRFPGGFVKLFGSNSTAGTKSTPMRYMVVEEPDDCNLNIKGQGGSIKQAEERVKSFPDHKLIIGGTPTVKGASAIDDEFEASNKCFFYVPCHECGEAHVLSFANLHWKHDESANDPVFGTALPETAYYVCPHCACLWDDLQKNRNILRAEAAGFGWRATAPFRGVLGFSGHELYSLFAESRMGRLADKWLRAIKADENGDPGPLIVFTNSSMGEAYEYKSDLPTGENLSLRAEDYAEFTIPHGGLLLTAGVDVQHDRLAVTIRAWGRGEESWLVYFGEIYGSTLVPEEGVWKDLDSLLQQEFKHACGAKLGISAVSVDSGDGNNVEAAYSYVRRRLGRNYMAVKGASEVTDDRREIFSTPKLIDSRKKTKADKFGLAVYKVGTTRAKDTLLENRLKLTGRGPGRMHWYKGVRADYWEQLLSEVKAPHRVLKGKKIWIKKSGVRNEGLDTEVYCLHAARRMKTNLMQERHWAAREAKLKQQEIFADLDQDNHVDEGAREAVTMSPGADDAELSAVAPALETFPKPVIPAAAPKPVVPPKPPQRQRQPSRWATNW